MARPEIDDAFDYGAASNFADGLDAMNSLQHAASTGAVYASLQESKTGLAADRPAKTEQSN